MNASSGADTKNSGRARWIGYGFVGAFAASVFTVIYTGLMVEGRRAEFDAATHFVTMTVAEEQLIRFYVESPAPFAAAALAISLPDMLEAVDPALANGASKSIALVSGRNELAVAVRATRTGSGYLNVRVFGDEPIGRDSAFVTVTPVETEAGSE